MYLYNPMLTGTLVTMSSSTLLGYQLWTQVFASLSSFLCNSSQRTADPKIFTQLRGKHVVWQGLTVDFRLKLYKQNTFSFRQISYFRLCLFGTFSNSAKWLAVADGVQQARLTCSHVDPLLLQLENSWVVKKAGKSPKTGVNEFFEWLVFLKDEVCTIVYIYQLYECHFEGEHCQLPYPIGHLWVFLVSSQFVTC